MCKRTLPRKKKKKNSLKGNALARFSLPKNHVHVISIAGNINKFILSWKVQLSVHHYQHINNCIECSVKRKSSYRIIRKNTMQIKQSNLNEFLLTQTEIKQKDDRPLLCLTHQTNTTEIRNPSIVIPRPPSSFQILSCPLFLMVDYKTKSLLLQQGHTIILLSLSYFFFFESTLPYLSCCYYFGSHRE